MSRTGEKLSTVGICCGYWCRHCSKGCCSVTSYQSERCVLRDFIFKKRRNSNVQASRFVLTIRLGRFEVTFPHISQMNPIFPIIIHFYMEGHTKQLLGNARISSILIVAKESHESSTLSVYPCSQCMGHGAEHFLFYCEPQREKSKKWNLCSTLQATIEDKYKIAHWRKAKQMQLVWLFVLW